MQKARSQAPTHPKTRVTLLPLVSMWFQALFHSPLRGAFYLSLTVLVHYRSPEVFSLTRWSALIPTEFHVFGGTWDPHGETARLSPTGLPPCIAGHSMPFG